nr:unnamed protein product [Digitaria exilis]
MVDLLPMSQLRLQRNLAADIKALLERASAVSERRARYRIDPAALPRSPWFAPAVSAGGLRRADDDTADQFVGIKEQADKLAERIKAIHAEDDKKLKVLSIVGFGGLGKTTLAMELCRQLESEFQRQAVVSVSQAFDGGKDMQGLLARLLPQIVKVMKRQDDTTQTTHTPEEEDEATGRNNANEQELIIEHMDVEQLSTRLKDLLKEKRYLIVIDDIWSLPAWEAIRIRLPENNCGSRIIVTTRIQTVAEASSISEDCVHHMKPLAPKSSEELFIKRVFGSMGTCPDGLEDIMRKILKKCGGLPLAIVKIASILASYNSTESVEIWIRVSNSIGSHMENHPTLEGIRKLTTLSYGYLPHHLKACMMYLSIFPEDYVIAKDRLLYRWIAEGLVTEKRGLTLFDVAEEYFNELISRNMIQKDKLSMFLSYGYWGYGMEMVEACRVHDMMLEVMVSISQEANFVSLVGRQYGGGLAHGTVRRLSVHGSNEEEELLKHTAGSPKKSKKERVSHGGIKAMKLHHVRSLSTFQVEGLGKLLDRLGEFRLLRVLDLEGCKAMRNKHMRDVCRLYLLRFLGLRGTSIAVMDGKIGDLGCLESLDVEQTQIHSMPPTVTKLSKLERMRVPEWILPRGLGNTKALREVSVALLEDDGVQVAREIGQLQQLQMLSMKLSGNGNGPNREGFLHALASSLSKTNALRTLLLQAYPTLGEDLLDFLLHVSSPPPLLRRLGMSGRISHFPDWISSLKHLADLSMWWTNLAGDQLLDLLCELPNLQILKLGYESCRDRELVARTRHKFPALRILELLGHQYHQGVKFEEGSMTKLERLVLSPYYNVESSIVGIDNLKELKEVKLVSDTKNNPLMKRALQQLKEENENRSESNQIKVLVE